MIRWFAEQQSEDNSVLTSIIGGAKEITSNITGTVQHNRDVQEETKRMGIYIGAGVIILILITVVLVTRNRAR